MAQKLKMKTNMNSLLLLSSDDRHPDYMFLANQQLFEKDKDEGEIETPLSASLIGVQAPATKPTSSDGKQGNKKLSEYDNAAHICISAQVAFINALDDDE